MANLQIKGIDDQLYLQIKEMAAAENRSVSQQILFLVSRYMANKKLYERSKTPAEVLLSLSGSWEDARSGEAIVSSLRKARKVRNRFKGALDVLA